MTTKTPTIWTDEEIDKLLTSIMDRERRLFERWEDFVFHPASAPRVREAARRLGYDTEAKGSEVE